MKRHLIPQEYVKELNENPCVEQATQWTVSFTVKFKEHAYEAYIGGKSMNEIFTEAGFDVKKLGRKRIDNFRRLLVEKSSDEARFSDKRKDKSLCSPPSTEAQLLKRIRELEHKNAYLEQENEFLKKIQDLEKEYGGKVAKRK